MGNLISKWLDKDDTSLKIWINDYRWKRVGLYTLTYDEGTGWYHQDYVHIPRRELPPQAVHVTGRNYKDYYLDKVGVDNFPVNGQATAIDYYLHMVNTSIDQSLANKVNPLKNVDMKKLGIALLVGVVGIYAFMTMV